ncbi:alpha/beta hydrolase family protein [Streptomyces johnsoniae]|uniref:Prolyl oligopeptidase family serine peptidase n=1 Tax=Streptomyces johnsoniae TaxID=3075532 RepID=A0ABU2S840_9ACTN|nr:prolyl oligopeptidase family serine peptidase [Streptomyces sp. DSM 41886]MDT0444260.1 prolyl oligopeptidase family serine peptidase [Streptomyces sp. DSM 41886]
MSGAGKISTGTSGADAGQFTVSRPVLPSVCRDNPAWMAFVGDARGRCEIFAWHAGRREARQVTDRPTGTVRCAIDPHGVIWWFAERADGTGEWQTQDFAGGPDVPAFAGVVPRGRPAGLILPGGTMAAAGLADDEGLTVRIGRRGAPPRHVLRFPGRARLAGYCPQAGLLAIARAPGDHEAVTVLTPRGRAAAVLSGRAGRVWPLGFAPGHTELLLVREHADGYQVVTWRADRGLTAHPGCTFDTEITAQWYPRGRRVLIRQERHGRSVLTSADLDRARTRTVPTPPGTVLDATAEADGTVHCLFTDTTTPAHVLSFGPTTRHLPPPPPSPPPLDAEVRERWTDGPDGPVHTLLALPPGRTAPGPVVFLVHGGPARHDKDAYDPAVHSLVASGLAVARVNYRGSTAYGPRWRAAWSRGVGWTQIADLAAVRADLVAAGIADPAAVGLWGTSWGAYLVLLALGRQPALWRAAVAVKPLADYVTAWHLATPALRALDSELFGGTPEQVPERYARSSPLTCVSSVRAPLLVIAATRDAKCPPEQVRSYLNALREAGGHCEELWLDSGHDGLDGADHVRVLRHGLYFLARGLRTPRAGLVPPHRSPERR